jgi:hypothetical protein
MFRIEVFAFVALCLAAVAVCDSRERIVQYVTRPRVRYSGGGDDYNDDAKYQFAYQVKAGGGYGSVEDESSEFGHAESRDGDRTNGRYFVQLPDGRLQTVEYYVDGDSGFVAKVSYDGEVASTDDTGYRG